MEQWIPVLSRCPIFRNMSEQKIIDAFKNISYVTEEFEKGKVIFRAEETSRRIGIILAGCLEMRKYLPSGKVLSMFHRRCGEMIGGSIIFSSNPRYPCDVIAKEKSLLLWIDQNAMLEVFLKDKTIAFNVLRISADRIMQFERRVELFSFYSIQKKIAFSLLHDFKIDQKQTVFIPFSKTTWAEYLNVSRTSLSRELKIMCTQGVIEMNGNKISILQMNLLESLLY